MRNIEEFIDRQLFLESKEAQSINSLINEVLRASEIGDDEYANAGNAAEYLSVIAFYDKFMAYKKHIKDIKIKSSMDYREAALKARELTHNSKKIVNKYEGVLKDAQRFVDKYFNDLYFRREFLDPEDLDLASVYIKHTGQEMSGLSSGDLEIIFHYKSLDPNQKDIRKSLAISLKRGNKKIYGASKFSAKKIYKDPNQQIRKQNLPKTELEKAIEDSTVEINSDQDHTSGIDTDAVKFEGGGPLKIFQIFGFDPKSYDESTINTLVKDGQELKKLIDEGVPLIKQFDNPNVSEKVKKTILKKVEANSKDYNKLITRRRQNISSLYSSFNDFFIKKFYIKKRDSSFGKREDADEVINLFNIFLNLITRSESNVKTFADLKDKQTIFNIPVVKRYIGHIKRINIENNKSSTNPKIKFSIDPQDVSLFEKTLTNKESTFNNELYQNLYKFGKKLNRLNELTKDPNQQPGYLRNIDKVLSLFDVDKSTIISNDKKSLEVLYNKIIESSNKILNSLKGELFHLTYQFKLKISYEDKLKEKMSGRLTSDDSQFSTAGTALTKFADSMNALYELQYGNNGVPDLFEDMENILRYSSPVKKNESIESLISSLILEQLDEKEYSKVMKKVNSCGAKGLISAVPSNKTANTIAVRFDADESIDAGIKKVKSSLRSSGYEIEDKRVLKFDQNRDTTDVIKNGNVVARLFFRADIKERKGLAYEHIIGAVLTKKITDQLKNRIDLPPDASKEEVMKKLRSEEFGKLFQSAKKAAPLITQKVGNIVSAESVGSTNNKADFVLKTDNGKTVGLSAKYAAGEKDNEYKMNKVLGFGTEEDSLVQNPKGIPWWIVGRKTFLKKLKSQTSSFGGREYNPDPEDLDAPAWMKSAKESNPDIYKETMEDVYAAIRNILTINLKKLGLKGLIAFVNEADLGKEEERENYDTFLKVMDGPSGLSVTEINLSGVQTDGIQQNINIDQVVVQDRSDIIIKIPGHNELKINSVKFKSDMLSSKAGDLKIKTR